MTSSLIYTVFANRGKRNFSYIFCDKVGGGRWEVRESSFAMHSVYELIISDLNDAFNSKAEVFYENKIIGLCTKTF